ncbi:MAG: rane protein [Solirubrobacterales bacterium]|nr:rane protein [Solirubrobacterales bacterium]
MKVSLPDLCLQPTGGPSRTGRRVRRVSAVAESAAPPASGSLWRAGPWRLLRLVAGLWLFGTGEGLVVVAALGNSPWTVFAQGLSEHTPLSIGAATIVTSAVLLLVWTQLDVRPGLGTIANALIIGVAIDVTLGLCGDPHGLPLRIAVLLAGLVCVGVGSGVYLGCRLGPGPRDGLMLGLHARTGWSIARLRTLIELSALTAGVLLGGRAGLGTVAFALFVGPAVALGLRLGERGAPATG